VVAVIICSQTRGGWTTFSIARPTARVESTRDFIIAFKFASV